MLILHFDINETILIGDDAGGDTVDDCLNKVIAKSAFVQIPEGFSVLSQKTKDIKPTHWWDGSTMILNDRDGKGDDQQPNENENGSPLPPPLHTAFHWPPNACPYYRTAYKRSAKTFTEDDGHGKIYRPLYNQLKSCFLQEAETKTKTEKDDSNSNSNSPSSSQESLPPSHPFFRMIPSFFHTLVELQKSQQEYKLILRTFGSDLDDIVTALEDFAMGKHPLFPTFRDPKLVMTNKNNMYKGRYRKVMIPMPMKDEGRMNNGDGDDESQSDSNSKNFEWVYDLHRWKDESRCASGDDEVLEIIQHSSLSICAIQDDYHHWDRHNNSPEAGKPCWVDRNGNNGTGLESTDSDNDNDNVNDSSSSSSSSSFHHIFFDDNIHNDANDSIVAVRSRNHLNHWYSLGGEETIRLQGRNVVRVPTVSAILNKNFFLEKIRTAQDLIKA